MSLIYDLKLILSWWKNNPECILSRSQVNQDMIRSWRRANLKGTYHSGSRWFYLALFGSHWLFPCLSLSLYDPLWLPPWLPLALTGTLRLLLALTGSLPASLWLSIALCDSEIGKQKLKLLALQPVEQVRVGKGWGGELSVITFFLPIDLSTMIHWSRWSVDWKWMTLVWGLHLILNLQRICISEFRNMILKFSGLSKRLKSPVCRYWPNQRDKMN